MTANSSIRIAYGDHPSQFGVLRMPDLLGRSCPVVVTIHGGFWKSEYGLEELDPLDEDLTRRGYATWNIEYRRAGEDGGGWSGTFDDVIDAVNQLSQLEERFHLDLSRVVILGHSAGGHLALWLASRINKVQTDELGDPLIVPIKGVISLAGISDLREMWKIHADKGICSPVALFIGGTPQEVPDRYCSASPVELLPLGVEQILIHGELDRHVPIELSSEYHRRAIGLGDEVSLVVLPEVEHFQIINPTSSAWISVTGSLETIFSPNKL
ncbi:alpha/beta hydrolase family protein [Paenibacillus sp. HW567]|uniref:alpha/beta hydrolase family protein n=1 Tax=Paenibacillus sp. HW567 TaxID=1034769 RepID=UPI0003A36237|nr:alpha/beta hydrolase [Paenibacillus sp. HW567]